MTTTQHPGSTPGIDAAVAAVDSAAEPAASDPLRRCIVSREARTKDQLVRFVVGPGNELVPDVDERLPGRGIWVSADRASVATAAAKHLFAKAAKSPVAVPGDLPDRLEALLARRALGQLGLAKRAGAVVSGATKVRGWLDTNRAGLLLCAADSAEDGRRKIKAAAGGIAIVEVFSSAELSSALGSDNVHHVAVAPGRFADRIGREAARVAGFRRVN